MPVSWGQFQEEIYMFKKNEQRDTKVLHLLLFPIKCKNERKVKKRNIIEYTFQFSIV